MNRTLAMHNEGRLILALTWVAMVLAMSAVAAPTASAQTVQSAGSACEHQPNPGTKIVPTRTFKPIVPGQATQALENPLRRGVRSPLTLLTFGDSAVWGNGLEDRYKYAHLVATYVASATGRTVNVVAYAQSGANIANEVDSCYESVIASDGGTPPGDLNAGLPTILQQEAAAAASGQYQDAELVLLDGCINDVSAEKIALPFPFSRVTPEEIRHLVRQWCSDKMLTLLQNTRHDFPLATVIVANYWLIISDRSSPFGLTRSEKPAQFTPDQRALYRDYANLIAAQVKAEAATGQSFTGAQALSDPAAVLQKWSDNSRAFLDSTEACFRWAVAAADGMSAELDISVSCPGTASVDPQPVTAAVRTFLAKVSDDPRYSYGAGREKRIWSVPSRFFRPDQLYQQRGALCESHYRNRANKFICHVNPTAHPNVRGAKAYTDSITQIMAVAWGSSRAPGHK